MNRGGRRRNLVVGLAAVLAVGTGLALGFGLHGEAGWIEAVGGESFAASARAVSTRSTNNAWRKPALRLTDLGGKERSLQEWQGRVILLNFWATWCPPCVYETRDLIRYQREWGDAGLQVVGVGLDQRRKLGNFARSYGINYPVLVTGRAEGAHLLGTWGDSKGIVPYTVVIGRDGEIVFSHAGQFSDQLFEDFVRPLLQDDRA